MNESNSAKPYNIFMHQYELEILQEYVQYAMDKKHADILKLECEGERRDAADNYGYEIEILRKRILDPKETNFFDELVAILNKAVEDAPADHKTLQKAIDSADKDKMYKIGRGMGYAACAQDLLRFLHDD